MFVRRTVALGHLNYEFPGTGATVTTNKYERLRMQRRMQRRIRMVVEERRMARARRPEAGGDPEATIELQLPESTR